MSLQDIKRSICANLPAGEKGGNISCQRLLVGGIAVMLTSFAGFSGLWVLGKVYNKQMITLEGRGCLNCVANLCKYEKYPKNRKIENLIVKMSSGLLCSWLPAHGASVLMLLIVTNH